MGGAKKWIFQRKIINNLSVKKCYREKKINNLKLANQTQSQFDTS